MPEQVAVISDVHSNLEALLEVLSRVKGMDVYCLGDIVGYGANPNEVVEEIRNRRAVALMGNHDYAAVTGDVRMFNPRAAMAAKWTSKTLTSANLEFLGSLPKSRRLRLGGVEGYLTHGSPDDPLWEYVDPRTHSELLGHYLVKLNVGILGLGHTHVPFVDSEGRGVVFNPGSVGQPRDGDWRASYAIVTVEDGEVGVENMRMEYDWKEASSKIRAVGLPEQLADRLSSGT